MTNKHTPAPWGFDISKTGKSFVVFQQNENPTLVKHIAGFKLNGDFNMLNEDYANAQLIAAAPELLEALKMFIDWKMDENYLMDARKKGIAAIAKAEGN